MPEFMHVEHNPEDRAAAMVQLQSIVDRLTGEYAGNGDQIPVRAALEEAIGTAGLPEQPEKWVSDTAAEIAAGRTVVVDRRIESVPELAASEVRKRRSED